jgi:hypothetical protein
MRLRNGIAFAFSLFLATTVMANDKVAGGIEVEKLSNVPGKTKIVLIAGSSVYKPGEHDYVAGCAALFELLKQTPGVEPVLAIDWPKNAETLKGAKSVVMFFDGGEKHGLLKEGRYAQVKELANEGVGLVFLHQLMDVAVEHGDKSRALSGAAWEKGFSARAHWVADFSASTDHPIFHGVKPFKVDDGWLTSLRFVDGMKGVTPLLRTVSPNQKTASKSESDSIVAWTYERDRGGRSVSFTGGHLHNSLLQEGYRRFLVNAILWSAGMKIPSEGAPVVISDERVAEYLKK